MTGHLAAIAGHRQTGAGDPADLLTSKLRAAAAEGPEGRGEAGRGVVSDVLTR